MWLWFLIFSTIMLTAHPLNPNSVGRGGVDVATGGTPNAIFSNPSNLMLLDNEKMMFDPLDLSLFLNRDTLDFLIDLSSDFDDAKKVSDLMKKNIGKTLSFRANNFASIYSVNEHYGWLLGLQNDITGHFITHSGFGSIGAMESYIERYRSALGSLSFGRSDLNYGLNIRAVEKYQTIHNYSIGEMIENDSFIDYFDNRYTIKRSAIALDAGVDYRLSERSKLALSILDIGDTSFEEIGKIASTTNIGLSSSYRDFEFGVDYIDLFGAEQGSSFGDSIRFGVSHAFWGDSLVLRSGVLYESLTYGIEYNYSILHISLASYRAREYNGLKDRKYLLTLSTVW